MRVLGGVRWHAEHVRAGGLLRQERGGAPAGARAHRRPLGRDALGRHARGPRERRVHRADAAFGRLGRAHAAGAPAVLRPAEGQPQHRGRALARGARLPRAVLFRQRGRRRARASARGPLLGGLVRRARAGRDPGRAARALPLARGRGARGRSRRSCARAHDRHPERRPERDAWGTGGGDPGARGRGRLRARAGRAREAVRGRSHPGAADAQRPCRAPGHRRAATW